MNIMDMNNIMKPAPSKAYFSFILLTMNPLAVMNAPTNPNDNTVMPMIVS